MALHPAILELLGRLAPDRLESIASRLEQFGAYLLSVNQKINLVSRRATEKVVDDLIFDSLAMLLLVDYSQSTRLLDVGSGAGFPWVVHKLIRSDLQVVSVDSRARKIEFQHAAAKLLGLSNCILYPARIESLPEQNADYCVAKGLGAVENICRQVWRHLRKGGLLILPRSAYEPVFDSAGSRCGFSALTDCLYESSTDRRQSRLIILTRE